MLLFNNCCGRWSLRAGSNVIAALDLVYMVALIIWMLAAPEFWAKVLDHMYGKEVGPPMSIILPVWYAICGFCCLLLIGGTVTRNPVLVIPWLVKDIMAILIAMAQLTYSCIYFDATMLVIEPFTIAYSVYFFIVVFSTYRQMKHAINSDYGAIPSNLNPYFQSY